MINRGRSFLKGFDALHLLQKSIPTKSSKQKRFMSTTLPQPGKPTSGKQSSSLADKWWIWVGTPIAVGVVAFYVLEPWFHQHQPPKVLQKLIERVEHALPHSHSNSKAVDFEQVRKDIVEAMNSNPDYDGLGSYGPVLVRLAWHSSGSYDAKTGTGGSNGAGMRFDPESKYAANAGLNIARELLEPIKKRYGDALSYGDLWTFAGVVAIEELGGPVVDWHPGRKDVMDGGNCPPDGRLPDATKGAKHLREIFYRMGFNDQEIVALSGAHVLGKCHPDRSGFDLPWVHSPTTFSNAYFTHLTQEEWIERKTQPIKETKKDPETGRMTVVETKVPWKGPKQFVDKQTECIMMLPTDMELLKDADFKKWALLYAQDEDRFFKDFAKAFAKLVSLGVPEAQH